MNAKNYFNGLIFTTTLFLVNIQSEAAWTSQPEGLLIKEADEYVKTKPEPLQQFFHTLYMEGEWNSVLNFNLLALAAIELSDFKLAERALDEAILRIQKIYSNDPNAAKAKELWSAEKVKDFKGEPYERAMTFFYRGILYLNDGDLQNARASFLQADLQNAMGQTESFEKSFSLATYMAGWASACDGDQGRASDLLQFAKRNAVDPFIKNSDAKYPAHLTLFERGIGPEKVTLGDYKSILSFLPQPDVKDEIKPVYSNRPASPALEGAAANIDWLALTRGGRPIQGILDGKVAFKQGADAAAEFSASVATVALYGSLGALGSDKGSVAKNLGILGAGSGLIGVFASMAAKATNAEADTRYWGSLPKYIYIEGYQEASGLEVKAFRGLSSKTSRPVSISQRFKNNCSFAYGREFSALDSTHGGIGNPSPWPAEPMEENRAQQNEKFRVLLKKEI